MDICCVLFFASSCQEHGIKGRHLATCTFPAYRNYDNPDADEVFCPFPPSVNRNIDPDASGEPLDYMSYFVDDYLIDLSDNRIDTTDFFRQYMAGFLISTRETAVSVCRSDVPYATENKMCQMIRATELVEEEPVFNDAFQRLNYIDSTECTRESVRNLDNLRVLTYEDAVRCAFEGYTQENAINFPVCPDFRFDFDNTTFTFVSDIGMTNDVSANFSVDGAVRNYFEGGGGHFGRVHHDSSQITGATIYYNNQV